MAWALIDQSLLSVRQESPLGVTPLDITGYHPPWKQLTDFALRPDPDHPSPHFSSLVSQMHGYAPAYGPPPPIEMYGHGPPGPPPGPPHPDMPMMSGMLPFPGPGDAGPGPGYHDPGLGPPPPHAQGDDFGPGFEDQDCGQPIEGKV